ncbi:hypothetical protein BC830DRAFT_1175916 [Chytriomyces sp. MP71]|nr:hypothetical protein BC830DRAFT_1175916 [Chytriomyces sp. MP71]
MSSSSTTRSDKQPDKDIFSLQCAQLSSAHAATLSGRVAAATHGLHSIVSLDTDTLLVHLRLFWVSFAALAKRKRDATIASACKLVEKCRSHLRLSQESLQELYNQLEVNGQALQDARDQLYKALTTNDAAKLKASIETNMRDCVREFALVEAKLTKKPTKPVFAFDL